MTSKMSEKSYQAVCCCYCSELIPLSIRLLKLFVAESDGPAELHYRSHVFILRCGACSKENSYLRTEIETFGSESPQTGDLHRFGPSVSDHCGLIHDTRG